MKFLCTLALVAFDYSGHVSAQSDSTTLVVERFPNCRVHLQYEAITTEVVDTVLTSTVDGSSQEVVISSSLRRCPSGDISKFDSDGFLVAKGHLTYTYGASVRSGTWEFFQRGELIRTETYVKVGYDSFDSDPTCQSLE